MVDTSFALKQMWKDTCTIVVKNQEVFDKESKTTSYEDMVLVENEPCKLSFQTLQTATKDGVKAKLEQKTKLFLSNAIEVPAGSSVLVTRGNRTFSFSSSGLPAIFTNHQEIILEMESYA